VRGPSTSISNKAVASLPADPGNHAFFGLKASPLQLIRGNVGYNASYLRNKQQGSKLAFSR
jgi:hypothetical protein